jgi:tetratricopeptide (TPR) repeat protein
MLLRFGLFAAASSIALSSAAQAGETVLYQPLPEWVDAYQLSPEKAEEGPSSVLNDWQYRFKDGVVYSYEDSAVRLDNPMALMEQGTLKLEWAPDKGDLIVHKLEIIRDGEVTDLIAKGVRFDVLRREEGLESRLLDGRLTATLAVPGLVEGDILRVAHSVVEDDQALGEEVQAVQYLPSKPWQVGYSRAIVSWPEGDDVRWQASPFVQLGEPETRNGYRYVSVELPIAERPDMPFDAPSRYNRPSILQVGSFADWQELSRVMAPHFEQAAEIDLDGGVAKEVAKIAAKTKDPLERTVLAVRLVQDQVTYLLDGLEGGNYLPQQADDTWEKRYGDCKAKSVLLLSMLRKLGIDAQVVLIASQGGDALPELLPLPADFDHMIVRATIDGVEYWLDGTSTATRLKNVADVPPFHYALPLTVAGNDLVPVVQRSKAYPDMAMKIEVDHSAGIDLPFLFTIDIEVSGPSSARLRAMVDEKNPEIRKQLARSIGSGQLPGGQATDVELEYDDEEAVGHIRVKGVADSDFTFEDGKFVMGDSEFAPRSMFAPDRARRAWRDIPVQTAGPSRSMIESLVILPDEGDGFKLVGENELAGAYANSRTLRKSSLEAGQFLQSIETFQDLGEVSPERLPEEKRAALRLANSTLRLEAPEQAQWRWELDDSERAKRTAPARKAYDAAVAQADPDEFEPLLARARFLEHVFEYDAAVADYTKVLDEQPSSWLYLARAGLFETLGRADDALEDISSAYDLEPENETAFYLAEITAREGDGAAALELLEGLPIAEEEEVRYVQTLAMVHGYSGEVEKGLEAMSEQLAAKPDDAEMLNAACWYRGIFAVALEDALGLCTRAVELAEDPAASLDSRAMVRFRLGQYDEALADLDAVLARAPWMSPSRYMRGIVSLADGNAAGRAEVATALRQSPQLVDLYGHYGIKPKP